MTQRSGLVKKKQNSQDTVSIKFIGASDRYSILNCIMENHRINNTVEYGREYLKTILRQKQSADPDYTGGYSSASA